MADSSDWLRDYYFDEEWGVMVPQGFRYHFPDLTREQYIDLLMQQRASSNAWNDFFLLEFRGHHT
jgi:hypothetical protein